MSAGTTVVLQTESGSRFILALSRPADQTALAMLAAIKRGQRTDGSAVQDLEYHKNDQIA